MCKDQVNNMIMATCDMIRIRYQNCNNQVNFDLDLPLFDDIRSTKNYQLDQC